MYIDAAYPFDALGGGFRDGNDHMPMTFQYRTPETGTVNTIVPDFNKTFG